MGNLKSKTILVISPQAWGTMLLSKHHYSIELASRGNVVYFLNPPDPDIKERIEINPIAEVENLFIIKHRLNFTYHLKFRCIKIFHFFMRRHVKKIISHIGYQFDIVWSFDLGNLYPLNFFSNSYFFLLKVYSSLLSI